MAKMEERCEALKKWKKVMLFSLSATSCALLQLSIEFILSSLLYSMRHHTEEVVSSTVSVELLCIEIIPNKHNNGITVV